MALSDDFQQQIQSHIFDNDDVYNDVLGLVDLEPELADNAQDAAMLLQQAGDLIRLAKTRLYEAYGVA